MWPHRPDLSSATGLVKLLLLRTHVRRASRLPPLGRATVLAGLVGIPNAAPYVASKHAVVGLTKAMAIDWGQYNVRVVAICPGMTRTNLSNADLIKNPDMFVERELRIPLGHAADREEQVKAILFLASSEASNVHGSGNERRWRPVCTLVRRHSAPRHG